VNVSPATAFICGSNAFVASGQAAKYFAAISQRR
jgi:hypothetical protein